jgi:hypothetical protein
MYWRDPTVHNNAKEKLPASQRTFSTVPNQQLSHQATPHTNQIRHLLGEALLSMKTSPLDVCSPSDPTKREDMVHIQ